MRKTTLAVLGLTVILAGAMFYYSDYGKEAFGAFGDPFLSVQLATSPSNGLCLTTDGTNNSWGSCSTGSGVIDPFTHPNVGTSATTTILQTSGLVTGSTTISHLTATSTATSTFNGDIDNSNRELVAHVIRADSSDGTQLKSNSGVPVAVLGTVNTANSLFYGGVNIDGATRLATSLSGFLKATAGAISTAAIDLTADITGTLPILNGGTNATRLSSALLWFDGTSVAATSSQVTVGSLNATTTATSTFIGGIETSSIGTTATSTLRGLQIHSGGLKIPLVSCGTLDTNSSGDVICGTDAGITSYDAWTHAFVGQSATSSIVYTSGLLTGTTTVGSFTATSTATSTFAGGVEVTNIGATTATSTLRGLTVISGGVKIPTIASCSQALETDANGAIVCGTDQTASLSGGVNNTIATWNSTTGINATSSFPLWIGSLTATTTASSTFAGPVGVGTTSPLAKLAVEGTAGMTFPIFHVASSSNVTPFFSINGWDGWSAFGTSTASTSRRSAKLTIWDEQTSGRFAFNIVNSASTTILQIPNNLTSTSTFFNGLQALQIQANSFFATSTNATSSFSGGLTADSLTVTKRPTFSGITSALILTGAQGQTSAYGGITCTNQVVEDVSAAGAGTCVSINNGYWSGTQLAIGNGGTNATRFSNGLVWYNGTALEATSTAALTVSGIFATTTATSTFVGGLGVATTTPWSKFTLDSGALTVAGNVPATSTVMVLDVRTANQFTVQLGNAATQINMRGYVDGSQWRVLTCNANAATAGAVTWLATTTGTAKEGIAWAGGTTPTQTTTAGKCDVWSFIATYATSTAKNGIRVFGAQTANF